jgi:GWxTD domain-containing protein
MLIAAIAAAAALASHTAGQSGTNGIEMRAVRFWLPEARNTSVMATVNIPYALATPAGTGDNAYVSYLVGMRVVDDNGKVLHEERWRRHASAALRSEGGSGLEELDFGVVPGNYLLTVDVTDSVTGRVTRDSIKLSGYPTSPEASDLLLASRLRLVTADTNTQEGEMARGAYRFNTAPVPHIDANTPVLGFLMEVYSRDSSEATLALKIATMDGTDLVPLMPTHKSIPAGGGLIANQFSLDGLPAGQYLLKASLTVGGKTVDRQAPFVVNTTPVIVAQAGAGNAARGSDEAYFNSQPEDSLDTEAEELSLLNDVPRRDLAVYKRDELSVQAKRHFLTEFWAKRDPNKGTPENEARIQFYNAVNYANAHYSTRFTPGWKTPLGKVYASFGPPDDSLVSTMGGRGIPYLVWRYTHGKARWFIFGDRQNNNNYILLRSSNEPGFIGTPGWRELTTYESTYDIAQWLGYPKTYFNNDN